MEIKSEGQNSKSKRKSSPEQQNKNPKEEIKFCTAESKIQK